MCDRPTPVIPRLATLPSHDPPPPPTPPLPLHDALPISRIQAGHPIVNRIAGGQHQHGRLHALGTQRAADAEPRSEEHTSELQSHVNLVCRLLLEKRKTRLTPWRIPMTLVALPHATRIIY